MKFNEILFPMSAVWIVLIVLGIVQLPFPSSHDMDGGEVIHEECRYLGRENGTGMEAWECVEVKVCTPQPLLYEDCSTDCSRACMEFDHSNTEGGNSCYCRNNGELKNIWVNE